MRNTRLSKISSVALVEDSGAYSGVVVAAHEIGHLLGAVHDGDPPPSYLRSSPGAKACPWRDGYMMSDLRRTSRGLQWSECSIKQMKHFLRTSTASCLYNTPHNSNHPLPGPGSLPGANITLNAQCQARHHDIIIIIIIIIIVITIVIIRRTEARTRASTTTASARSSSASTRKPAPACRQGPRWRVPRVGSRNAASVGSVSRSLQASQGHQ